jgi:hypothetical protein
LEAGAVVRFVDNALVPEVMRGDTATVLEYYPEWCRYRVHCHEVTDGAIEAFVTPDSIEFVDRTPGGSVVRLGGFTGEMPDALSRVPSWAVVTAWDESRARYSVQVQGDERMDAAAVKQLLLTSETYALLGPTTIAVRAERLEALLSAPRPSAATMLEPHDRLGVARGASPQEIDRAFRKMSLKLHPDKVLSGLSSSDGLRAYCITKFQALNAAREAMLAVRADPDGQAGENSSARSYAGLAHVATSFQVRAAVHTLCVRVQLYLLRLVPIYRPWVTPISEEVGGRVLACLLADSAAHSALRHLLHLVNGLSPLQLYQCVSLTSTLIRLVKHLLRDENVTDGAEPVPADASVEEGNAIHARNLQRWRGVTKELVFQALADVLFIAEAAAPLSLGATAALGFAGAAIFAGCSMGRGLRAAVVGTTPQSPMLEWADLSRRPDLAMVDLATEPEWVLLCDADERVGIHYSEALNAPGSKVYSDTLD